jgi:hypothetical protein
MRATTTRTKSEMIEMAMMVTMLRPVPGREKKEFVRIAER